MSKVKDPIVEEVRRVREAILKKHGYNARRYDAAMKRQSLRSRTRKVCLGPCLIKPES
jgi:hypothetical protein